jgi:hypothetical protein
MRVEVVYSPGCTVSKSVRNTLEIVIAEERLPIPVEMIETTKDSEPPMVRIDGCEVDRLNTAHTLENFRDLLCGRWYELNTADLSSTNHH